MDELLLQLLESLDSVAKDHEEIGDSDCREQMGHAVFYGFIKPQPDYLMPYDFGLFSDEANAEVRLALIRYIDAANQLASELGINGFHQRLAAFQNGDVWSVARSSFDDYFGWMNPANFDQDGNVVQRG